MQWAAVLIAIVALGFTVFSFWWMQWRVGPLKVSGPSTYAGYAGEKLILLFPLAIYNAGPVPYVLIDLRFRFRDEPDGSPLDFLRIRSGVNPSDHPKPVDFAAAFPVPGNEVVRLFCEFERKPADRTMKVGPHPLVLEALTDKATGWQVLLEFDLFVNEKAEENMPGAFIAHMNRL